MPCLYYNFNLSLIIRNREKMQELPHQYHVSADAKAEGNIALKANNLPLLISAPPAEFGGPGDEWSPEHLLVASVADCFMLTFRAVARASKLEWSNIESSAVGVLDRVGSLHNSPLSLSRQH